MSVNPALAEVVVLSNRTATPVKCTLIENEKPAKTISIAPGDSNPYFYAGSLQLRYRDGQAESKYDLEAANAYFFARVPGKNSLHFERIGLGEGSFNPNATRGLLPRAVPTILVKLLVDDEEPTHRRVWEARLRKRLAAASEILERHSGVRLKVVKVSTWDSEDAIHKFSLSLREFEREVSPEPARLAIGFSSQYQIARGRIHLGGTRGTLHPYILLKERSPNVRETERLELLVHELGHFLGAAHSPEPQSVMRPLLTGGQQRAAGSRVQFDPVNTLLVALMGEELRRPRVRRLRDVSNPTKRRMLQIYSVLQKSLPEDPAAAQYQQMIRHATTSSLVDDTRTVLGRMVEVAKQNDPAQDGDELTDRYVRAAAAAAQTVHPENAKRAFLLALGIFIDDTETLRKFPPTQAMVKAVETEPMRRERLRSRGAPTMHSRGDLAKHFFVSAHMTVMTGSWAARAFGLAKETLDAQAGGTGFSFADMAANRAGILFAERLLRGKISLTTVAQKFSTKTFLPPIADLDEGLTADELQEQFDGKALEAELRRIERRILELPAYRH